ncbi:fimbria/pilus outer membrane usher protein [Qipengyuania flava]|uniref:fimbria/pilus outer membrane usher protein n=1 Tax=Qipengyuania flava TaxID=192812 RepID=UPI001C629292|nr:fimbria/pilus outer membrane usher protein [Qipengyuania flava]QYJ07297.1 fimbria/pilus outer membrane usher protein [Qipengyuania flava]
MSRSLPPAAKPLFAAGLVAASALAAPAVLHAQASDPFAIDRDLTFSAALEAEKQGPGLSVIYVDGLEQKRMVELKWIDGELAILAESAETAGIPIEPGATGFIKLSQLEIANFEFDRVTQRLMVKKFRRGDGPNDVNVARRNYEPGERAPLLAGIVNYNLTASVSGGKTQVGAYVAPRVSYGNFNLGSAFTYRSNPGPDRPEVVRLDTTATLAIPEKALVARAGDVITTGSDAQRAVRVGGIQIGTDYGLRPDIITNPLPQFAGQVAVPTSVDLIVNDRRFQTSEIEAGDFRVHNIPMAAGRGEVSVVLKDELGQEVIQTAQVYIAPDMLEKGRMEWGATMGWVRRRYGTISNDYRDLVGTFFVRRGLSKSLSVGVSGEVGNGVWNVGAQAQATIANVAMTYGEVRYSRTSQESGVLFRGGVESMGRGVSARIEAVVPSSGYRDIAAQSGDGRVPRQLIGSVDFDLAQTTRFQISATRVTRPAEPLIGRIGDTTTVLRASARHELNKRMTLTGDVSYRRAQGRGELVAGINLNIRFGPRSSASASIRHSRDEKIGGQVSYFRPDTEVGEVGYAAHAKFGANERVSGTVAYRAPFARFAADAEYTAGNLAARGRVEGSLIVADNRVFARDRASDAYALVRTGNVGGVTVTHEHREVGKSDKGGRLLVTRVTPLVPMKFDVAPDKLPSEAVARSTFRRMQAPRGGVVLVDMDIEAYRSVLMRVVDEAGEPLDVGSTIVSLPSGREYMVAFDGLVDFNGLSNDTAIALGADTGKGCQTALPEFDLDSFDMPEVVARCTSRTIALKD